MDNLGKKIWGLIITVVGVIVGLNAMGVTDINIFFDGWWALIMIIPAVVDIIRYGFNIGSVVLLILGVACLLYAQGLFNFDIIRKLFFPAVLIFLGLTMMFKGGSARIEKTNGDEE